MQYDLRYDYNEKEVQIPAYFSVHMDKFLKYPKVLYSFGDIVNMLEKIVGDKWSKKQIVYFVDKSLADSTGYIFFRCIDGLLQLYYCKDKYYKWIELENILRNISNDFVRFLKIKLPYNIVNIRKWKTIYEWYIETDNGKMYNVGCKICPPYKKGVQEKAYHYHYGIMPEGVIADVTDILESTVIDRARIPLVNTIKIYAFDNSGPDGELAFTEISNKYEWNKMQLSTMNAVWDYRDGLKMSALVAKQECYCGK